MSLQPFPFALSLAGLAIGGLSLAALAVSQGNGTSSTADAVAPDFASAPEDLAALSAPLCSIDLDTSSGRAILSAQVTPETTLSGTFALRVTRQVGGNRSSIRQGGAFTAPAGETTILSLSAFNSGQGIDASLTIKAGGETFACDFPGLPMDS